jgi:hypothetical protein
MNEVWARHAAEHAVVVVMVSKRSGVPDPLPSNRQQPKPDPPESPLNSNSTFGAIVGAGVGAIVGDLVGARVAGAGAGVTSQSSYTFTLHLHASLSVAKRGATVCSSHLQCLDAIYSVNW